MNDKRRLTDDELSSRLARLPQEIPVSAELWSSIERAIQDEPTDEYLARLAADVEPETDLWPAIEARIRSDGSQEKRYTRIRWRTTTLLAACLMLFAIGSFFVLGPQQPGDGPEPGSQSPQLAESGYRNPAVEALFSETANAAAAQASTVYRDHIAMVRDERATIEAAMQQYPNDAALRTLWRQTYETELHLIDEAERVLTNI